MRHAILLVLLLPTASAWSVEVRAPAEAHEGVPFRVDVCADGEVRVLAANATLDVREDRYLPAGCRAIEARAEPGVAQIEARVRDRGGIKARAFANVTVHRAPGDLALVEARAPPLAGVVVRNVGNETARLGVRALEGAPLPDGELAPGASLFLGPRAPPDAERHVRMDVRVRNGTMELAVGARVESALVVPKLRAGESTAGRYGRTDIPARAFAISGDVEAYATPGPTPLPALIGEAEREVLVAAHTFTGADVAAALLAALDRGAAVRVLLEGAPPGGVPDAQRALVAALQARGAEVLALGGEGARYRSMHAKLVVVDRAVAAVSTENLNDGGSRGFGLIVRDAPFASAVAGVMDADAAPWHDVAPFPARAPPALLAPSLAHEVEPLRLAGERNVTLVLSPDDPRALAEAVASARASVDVAMLRAEPRSAMVDALVAAAREGARVRLALDGRHDDGVNRETVALLTALAAREGLDIRATLADPARTLHAKAFVVDARASYVGSMNWVAPAWDENREAGVLVDDPALAAWLAQEIAEEWEETEVPRAEVSCPAWGVMVAVAVLTARRGPRPRAPCGRA